MRPIHCFVLQLTAVSLGACGPVAPAALNDCKDRAFSSQVCPVEIPVTVRGNVVYLPVSINGAVARSVPFDTGSPVTIIDPLVFSDAKLSSGKSQTGTVGVGPLIWENVSLVAMSPCGATSCPTDTFAGLISGSVFGQTEVSLNYRDAKVSLGKSAVPNAVHEEISVDFKLEGGGLAAIPGVSGYVQLPATRIVVLVDVEGVDYTFIVDTGASLNVVSPDLYSKLIADGRGHVNFKALAIGGTVDVQATRIRRMAVGGVEVVGASALTGPFNLDALGQEVGRRVDGLLGGTFLREFLFKVGYTNSKLGFRRYADRSFISDEFHRVGVTLKAVETGGNVQFMTDLVLPGSHAAAAPSDFWSGRVLSIDGRSLDGLRADEVDMLLCGPIGAHRRVTVVTAANVELSFEFLVEDVLHLT